MDQNATMNLEMFYPPFPERVQFEEHTFIVPDFDVKFPIFRCCPNHDEAEVQEDEEMQKEEKRGKEQEMDDDFLLDEQKTSESRGYFGEEMDDFVLDEPESRIANWDVVEVIEPKKKKKTPQQRTPFVHPKSVDNLLQFEPQVEVVELDAHNRPNKEQRPSKIERSEEEVVADDHDEMDDFVLDEPIATNPNWLTFLRPNLVFDVVQKSVANFKKAIANLRAIHPHGAGLVFCMSKNECDDVAATIGDDAQPYHMDIADHTRKESQRRWMNNELLFLCATSAFDKSKSPVDKRNVRFILHHTMPQNLQIYEKQCAYAGQDGQLAHCVLFYSFNDHLRIARLLREDVPKPPADVLKMKEKALRDVMRYGENVAGCRRKFLANYFGQDFNSDHCMLQLGPCTICEYNAQGNQPMQLVDFTQHAFAVMWSMNGLKSSGVAYVADLFHGNINKKTIKKGIDESNHGRLPLLGLGRDITAADSLRFIQMLVIDEFVKLRMLSTRHNTVYGYVEIGPRGSDFLKKYRQPENVPPNERIFLHISPRKEKRRSSKGKNNSANAAAFSDDDDFENYVIDGDGIPIPIGASTSSLLLPNKRMRF